MLTPNQWARNTGIEPQERASWEETPNQSKGRIWWGMGIEAREEQIQREMRCWWNSPMGQVLSLRPAWWTLRTKSYRLSSDHTTCPMTWAHTHRNRYTHRRRCHDQLVANPPPPCQSRTAPFSHFASSLHYRLQLCNLTAWFLLNDKLLLATITSGAIFWFWVIQNTTVVRKQRRGVLSFSFC